MTRIQKIVSTFFVVFAAIIIAWMAVTQLDLAQLSPSYDANNLNPQQQALQDEMLAKRTAPVEFRSDEGDVLYCTDESGDVCQQEPFPWWGSNGAQLTEDEKRKVTNLAMVAPPNWYALVMDDELITISKHNHVLTSLIVGLVMGSIPGLLVGIFTGSPMPIKSSLLKGLSLNLIVSGVLFIVTTIMIGVDIGFPAGYYMGFITASSAFLSFSLSFGFILLLCWMWSKPKPEPAQS